MKDLINELRGGRNLLLIVIGASPVVFCFIIGMAIVPGFFLNEPVTVLGRFAIYLSGVVGFSPYSVLYLILFSPLYFCVILFYASRRGRKSGN